MGGREMGASVWLRGMAFYQPEGYVPYYPFAQFLCDFYKGIPEVMLLTKWFGPTKGGVMVLDDLMAEGGKDKQVLDLFTKDSHHRNITVLYLTQDLFPPGKFSKTINRNAHYLIAFKHPRDQTGIRNVLTQAFPTDWRDKLDLFQQVTSRPFGYLMLMLESFD